VYTSSAERQGVRVDTAPSVEPVLSQGARVALLPDLSGIRSGATAVVAATRGVRQSSNEVLMVAPTAFGFNEQAAQVRWQSPDQLLNELHVAAAARLHVTVTSLAWCDCLALDHALRRTTASCTQQPRRGKAPAR
jgi:hypothetical protein